MRYGSCAAAGQDPAPDAGHARHNKRDREQSAHRRYQQLASYVDRAAGEW